MSTKAQLKLETLDQDGLRFLGQSGSGRETRLDSGPHGVAPNPVETLLLALGGCEGMDVISILRKKRQQVTGYEIELNGRRRPEHPRAFTHIEILHRLRGKNLNAHAIEDAIRLSETKYCSVHASLAKEIVIMNRYEIVPE